MMGMVESGFILPSLEKKPIASGRGKTLSQIFICNIFQFFIFITD
jgi:hypothetical protein